MQRLKTGVPGLDDILGGGLPAGQMYLLEGNPGTGKTTIAMQFVLAGVESGKNALYVTLSEPRKELIASAESHDLDLTKVPIVEFVPDESTLSPDSQYTVFHPSTVELADTVQRLIQEIDKLQPDRLVIDSLSELRLMAGDKMRYRRQLLALKQYFAQRNTSVLLLDDRTAEGDDLQLQSIAHGVIFLEKVPRSYGVTRRRVEILKLRGSAYREGFHDYNIIKGGVVVYPRLIAAEHGIEFPPDQITSGIHALDRILGGGLDRGSSVLITGPTGVGKSTLALQYASAAAARGDRAVLYSFDEGIRSAKLRAKSLGMDLSKEVEAGHLQMTQIDPAELSPGQFIWQIRDDVDKKDVRFVVIDSLNGFLAGMPGEADLILQLHELLTYLNQRGVVTILVLAQQGLVGTMQTVVDVSYLADTVILLRYFEAHGAIRQAVSVLKKRIGGHERTVRELTLSNKGITVGEPLSEFRGVLTGIPEYLGTRTAMGQNETSG